MWLWIILSKVHFIMAFLCRKKKSADLERKNADWEQKPQFFI